jgi:hypothetical protein
VLKALQRWLGPQRSARRAVKTVAAANAWQNQAEWAVQKGHIFKRTREGDGFVIDASFNGQPWRLEWGPSQRSYISGHELRFRMELQLPSSLQMLVLNRTLLKSLERESFERYTEVNQTQVDVSTSEEMRWVAMFTQSSLTAQRALRPHFAALSSPPSHVEAWLQGDLAAALQLVNASVLPVDVPWVLMTLRGRTYMRMAMPEPKPALLDAMSKLFASACTEAIRVSTSGMDAAATSPSIAAHQFAPVTTAWQSDVGAEK